MCIRDRGERGIGTGQGELLLLGDRERQAQVLEEVLDQEAGLVVAVDRLRGCLLYTSYRFLPNRQHLLTGFDTPYRRFVCFHQKIL